MSVRRLAALTCGVVALPASGVALARSPVAVPPDCAGVVALLDTQYEMFNAFVDADAATVMAGIERVPALAVIIGANPPSDIAPSIEIWLANNVATFRLLHGLTDANTIFATLRDAPPAGLEVPQAQRAVEDWAAAQCGWVVPGTVLTPPTTNPAPVTVTTLAASAPIPEPADCGVLDPVVVIAAAGLEIDPADADGVSEGGGLAFRTEACSYGDGALFLTTIAYGDVAAASDEMIALATTAGRGEVLDIDVGGLPASTVVIAFDQAVQVVVFDSDPAFAVTVGGVAVDPARAVAAAQVVAGALPAPASTAPFSI